MGRHPLDCGGSPRATVVPAKRALAVLPKPWRNGTRQARHTRL